ncbi:uncharacterized protein LOC110862914 isoform X2 [Folsomia candida]|uniref:uncharacterized protein LOC110862914 isoform X2 n=1 Tax=Folsomia candida TaxID=158441 RepID=UPI0016054050|nr:uncharacterized protein LOC110862914 isoform X2 [Folsomia candida]
MAFILRCLGQSAEESEASYILENNIGGDVFEEVFGKCLTKTVSKIVVVDPQIRTDLQYIFFQWLRFVRVKCERNRDSVTDERPKLDITLVSNTTHICQMDETDFNDGTAKDQDPKIVYKTLFEEVGFDENVKFDYIPKTKQYVEIIKKKSSPVASSSNGSKGEHTLRHGGSSNSGIKHGKGKQVKSKESKTRDKKSEVKSKDDGSFHHDRSVSPTDEYIHQHAGFHNPIYILDPGEEQTNEKFWLVRLGKGLLFIHKLCACNENQLPKRSNKQYNNHYSHITDKKLRSKKNTDFYEENENRKGFSVRHYEKCIKTMELNTFKTVKTEFAISCWKSDAANIFLAVVEYLSKDTIDKFEDMSDQPIGASLIIPRNI